MHTVGIIILAAGASTRMGKPKQLLPYQGQSLLHHVAGVAITSGCNPVIVVLGANAAQIRGEVESLSVEVIENQQWTLGMNTSIHRGIDYLIGLTFSVDAAILLLCDQPFVSPLLLNRLIATYRTTQNRIVACAYADTIGVPALFDKTLFPALLSLRGTSGAKAILHQYTAEVIPVAFPEGAIDLDTPQDYESLLRRLSKI